MWRHAGKIVTNKQNAIMDGEDLFRRNRATKPKRVIVGADGRVHVGSAARRQPTQFMVPGMLLREEKKKEMYNEAVDQRLAKLGSPNASRNGYSRESSASSQRTPYRGVSAKRSRSARPRVAPESPPGKHGFVSPKNWMGGPYASPLPHTFDTIRWFLLRVYVEMASEHQDHVLVADSLGGLVESLSRVLVVADVYGNVYRGSLAIDQVFYVTEANEWDLLTHLDQLPDQAMVRVLLARQNQYHEEHSIGSEALTQSQETLPPQPLPPPPGITAPDTTAPPESLAPCPDGSTSPAFPGVEPFVSNPEQELNSVAADVVESKEKVPEVDPVAEDDVVAKKANMDESVLQSNMEPAKVQNEQPESTNKKDDIPSEADEVPSEGDLQAENQTKEDDGAQGVKVQNEQPESTSKKEDIPSEADEGDFKTENQPKENEGAQGEMLQDPTLQEASSASDAACGDVNADAPTEQVEATAVDATGVPCMDEMPAEPAEPESTANGSAPAPLESEA
eukprot:NODE_189_length_2222_cov_83.963185_g162_i0.p1 GENE.NODE_189_length_2222_cov_83.963185_g162_i0~~NODE_189_length_2222_cov_83.963185_g162_i0.p1  ORF type:complete len:507 (-),score=128.86 NODE_189_length_2222_cov_83.963185_g162_i0:64-1584(-)